MNQKPEEEDYTRNNICRICACDQYNLILFWFEKHLWHARNEKKKREGECFSEEPSYKTTATEQHTNRDTSPQRENAFRQSTVRLRQLMWFGNITYIMTCSKQIDKRPAVWAYCRCHQQGAWWNMEWMADMQRVYTRTTDFRTHYLSVWSWGLVTQVIEIDSCIYFIQVSWRAQTLF